jgi:hypothetical protein
MQFLFSLCVYGTLLYKINYYYFYYCFKKIREFFLQIKACILLLKFSKSTTSQHKKHVNNLSDIKVAP